MFDLEYNIFKEQQKKYEWIQISIFINVTSKFLCITNPVHLRMNKKVSILYTKNLVLSSFEIIFSNSEII